MRSFLPKRLARRIYGIGTAITFLCVTSSAWAQKLTASSQASLFAESDQEDWASGILSFMFQGGELPVTLSGYAVKLAPVADALRQALGAYSTSMLVIAALILLYYLVTFVVDTAQHGVVMGRKANQVWAPIRLVVAILLLVPIGNLSGGQYLVLKIAKIGSGIANRAWEGITVAAGGSFSLPATPHIPPLATLVTRAVEMEICRQIYDQIYDAQPSTPALQIAGPIGLMTKTAASPLAVETWRYSNTINVTSPLCGEYRFSGVRPHSSFGTTSANTIAGLNDDVAGFTHTEAESLQNQAHVIATKIAPAFGDKESPVGLNSQDELAALIRTLTADVDNHLQSITTMQGHLAGQLVTQPAEIGWIAAGLMLPALIHVQESYSEVIDHLLPDIQAPVLNHPALARQVLDETLTTVPAYMGLDHDTALIIGHLYGHVGQNMERAHNWLYASQLPDNAHILSSEFDLRAQLGAATESRTALSMLAHTLDNAGMAYGVWGQNPDDNDTSNPFAPLRQTRPTNPISSALEFGHRQMALGTYLFGIADSLLATTHITLPALIAGGVAGLFLIGGSILMFLIPLLPFFRFTAAILTWLLELFEAMAAIPLVAIAHLSPSGEGLSGAAARQTYRLWFSLAVRPVLVVFGLVLGFLLFTLGTTLLDVGLLGLARLSSASNSGNFIIANCGTVLIYDVLAFAIVNVAFRGITAFPERALRWITPLVMSDGQETNQNATATHTSSSHTTQLPPALKNFTQIATMIRNTATGHSDKNTGSQGMRSGHFPTTQRDAGQPSATSSTTTAITNSTTAGLQGTSSSTTHQQTTTKGAPPTHQSPSTGAQKPPNPHNNAPFFQDKTTPNKE